MKIRVLIIMALLVSLCMGRNKDSISDSPLGLDLTKEITIADLWNTIGSPPDSIGKLGVDNLIYYKGNVICYLLIDKLYSIEIKEGKFEHLKIGMKKRKIIRKLGKAATKTLPTREILEYQYGENINYIISLEIKRNKLTSIHIIKKV